MTIEKEKSISKAEYWQEHFKAWKESGKSRTAYCSENNLPLTTFDYWRKKVKSNPAEIELVGLPLTGRLAMNPAGIGLIINGQYRIEVENGFCPTTLSELLKVVRAL